MIERKITVPLKKARRGSKRRYAPKAVDYLKKFIARHLKVEEVVVGSGLNEFIWKRGITNPPRKVEVKAAKKTKSDKTAFVELASISGEAMERFVHRGEPEKQKEDAKKTEPKPKKQKAKLKKTKEKPKAKKKAVAKSKKAVAKPKKATAKPKKTATKSKKTATKPKKVVAKPKKTTAKAKTKKDAKTKKSAAKAKKRKA